MKKILSYLMAGIVGGLIVLGGSKQLANTTTQNVVNTQQQPRAILTSGHTSAYNGSGSTSLDFTTAAAKTMPAVVHIAAAESQESAQNRFNQMQQNNPFAYFFNQDRFGGQGGMVLKQGFGSGVIISEDGYIVTNNHVVDFADEFEVIDYNNKKYKAKLIGKDDKTDLAVLKIEAKNLPFISYGDSDEAKVGEWVLAVGNPFNLTSSVTAGIISAKGRNINPEDRTGIESFIQTDAAVNPGNSGGALVNTKGELIGINTAILSQTGSYTGYSFAIPVNMMKNITREIIKYGDYQRPYMGINISDMDGELGKELGIDLNQGVYVADVVEGGSADFAGIQPKDVIIGINNRKIKSVPELQEFIISARVGDKLKVKVNRLGKELDVNLILKSNS